MTNDDLLLPDERRGRPDHGGFAALELAILLPFIVTMLLLVAAFGRVERGRELVDQAAQAAARAASLAGSAPAAETAALAAARHSLADGGLSCSQMQLDVDTSSFRPGGTVGARLRCITDLSALTLSGVPGHVGLSGRAEAALETYRQIDTGSAA
jgi:hypothetical protein